MTLNGNSADQLAAQLMISPHAVNEAVRRGLVSFKKRRGIACWRFGDNHNGCLRRLDGEPFQINGKCVKVLAETQGESWHRLIGLDDVSTNDRREILLIIEGSKDALAAFEFAHRAGILAKVGVVTALGTGYRPIPEELLLLVGRRVFAVNDRDQAGIETVRCVSTALCKYGIDHVIINWNGFPNFHGKDLFDLLKSLNGQAASFFADFFSFPSLLQCSQYSLSSPSSLFSPTPFICTGVGQRNRKLFQLARATKQFENVHQRKLTTSELVQIFNDWYRPSAPFIQMGCDECLIHFLRLRDKVRFVAADVKEVMARAQSESLPDIGIKCVPLQKIAALCRALQRAQAGHPFFCSVRIAKAFAGIASESTAHDALLALESMGVIKCVKRGVPGNPGNPATRYRYLLPL
jgi:hypothetical protein